MIYPKFERGDRIERTWADGNKLVGDIEMVGLERYHIRWVTTNDFDEPIIKYTFDDIDHDYICIVKERDRKLKKLLGNDTII